MRQLNNLRQFNKAHVGAAAFVILGYLLNLAHQYAKQNGIDLPGEVLTAIGVIITWLAVYAVRNLDQKPESAGE